MDFDLGKAWDSVKEGTKEIAEAAHVKTKEFHKNYVSKVIPDCGKYGDTARFIAEMAPGVSEYNAIVEGDWTEFAIAAGIDVGALVIGVCTAGAGYAAIKGGSVAAKTSTKIAVKEVAEAGTKKVVKEVAEAGTKKVVKEVAEAGTKKVVKETAEAGVEKVAKETTETSVKTVAKERVKNGTEVVSKEAVEKIKEGGSYREVKKMCDGRIHEVHHMPAKSTSFLEELDGPAIKMDKLDHQKTASWGNSIEAREYRKMQQELVESGKFKKALELDIEDIIDKFPGKYDNAIKEMLEYVNKLELEGII